MLLLSASGTMCLKGSARAWLRQAGVGAGSFRCGEEAMGLLDGRVH